MPIESMMPSKHLILCHPFLLLPSIFTSIRTFSNESVLCTRWPKYWSFSFSTSPSNEYSGLISFRMDWLQSKDTQESSSAPQFESISSSLFSLLCGKSEVYDLWSVQSSCSVMSNSLWSLDCSMPGFPVHHQLPELAQTPVHWVGDAIQPSHPLSSPSPPAFNLSQHWGLFKWVRSLHQVAKVLKFQLQHQSFQWIFRTDFL